MNGKNEYALSLLTTNYWIKKQQFQLPSDRYPAWVIFMVEEGEFHYRIQNTSGKASKGDMVICPPEVDFHREIVSDSLTFHFILFAWREEYELVQKYKRLLESFTEFKINLTLYERILDNFAMLQKLNTGNHLSVFKYREHLINDTFIVLNLENEKTLQEQVSFKDPVINEIKRIFDRKVFDGFLIKDVADQFNLSKTQVTRRFHDAFGVKPMEYLTAIRMQRARILLTETTYTIDHIAQLCGYENGFYFSRVFTKHQQVSPKHYRQTQKL